MTEQASTISVSLSELLPVMEEVFAAGGSFRLPVTGTSNLPTLKAGRDEVILAQSEASLKKGDLPLYRRDNGQFVLHRVGAVEADGTYSCCGDHQWDPESGIRSDQIVGVVITLCRKDRSFSAERRSYRLWVRLWMFLLPCRRFLIRLYHAPAALKRKLIKTP